MVKLISPIKNIKDTPCVQVNLLVLRKVSACSKRQLQQCPSLGEGEMGRGEDVGRLSS